MKIILNNLILDSLNLSSFKDIISNVNDTYHFYRKSGETMYRLLAYLSCYFNNKLILDIGTCTGTSALALSFNQKNRVISFDTVERQAILIESKINTINNVWLKDEGFKVFYLNNIDFIISKDFMKSFSSFLLVSDLILLDIDHSGIKEKQIYDFLVKNNYKGILLLDDIIQFDGIINLWKSIDKKKYDLTKYGNFCGTGLVDFSDDLELFLG